MAVQKKLLFGAPFSPKVCLAETPPHMCQKVVENYIKRINITSGGHLNDVVFHTKVNVQTLL